MPESVEGSRDINLKKIKNGGENLLKGVRKLPKIQPLHPQNARIVSLASPRTSRVSRHPSATWKCKGILPLTVILVNNDTEAIVWTNGLYKYINRF
jgi:hypothetical protein